jgi:phosphopantetheinyl transferase
MRTLVAVGDYPELHDSGTRRVRVACKHCGVSIEIARLREHLRSSHNLDSAVVETSYLAALMDVRRNRRGRA